MSLYISNPSKQDVVFHYRQPLPRPDNLLAHVMIPSGSGVEIGKRWSAHQKELVIDQLQVHGARDASEVHSKLGRFLGLLYRDNGQITEGEILMGHDQVVDTQRKRSVTEATRGALAFDRKAQERGRGQRVAKVTGVEVRQELEKHQRPTGDEVDFSLSIDPEGREDAPLSI
jgi:hypothetical protein